MTTIEVEMGVENARSHLLLALFSLHQVQVARYRALQAFISTSTARRADSMENTIVSLEALVRRTAGRVESLEERVARIERKV